MPSIAVPRDRSSEKSKTVPRTGASFPVGIFARHEGMFGEVRRVVSGQKQSHTQCLCV